MPKLGTSVRPVNYPIHPNISPLVVYTHVCSDWSVPCWANYTYTRTAILALSVQIQEMNRHRPVSKICLIIAEICLTIADRIMPSLQDVQVLTPRTCEYVTWRGKRDRADMIKLSRWSQCHYIGPYKPKREVENQSDLVWEDSTHCCWLWRWRKGPWIHQCGQPPEP